MSDVLFDTGKYSLKPNTQISLAKVAGILQAYPGLKLQVEGYTDSVGGDGVQPEALRESRRCCAGFSHGAGCPAMTTFSSPDMARAIQWRTTAQPVGDPRTAGCSWSSQAMRSAYNRATPRLLQLAPQLRSKLSFRNSKKAASCGLLL